MKPEDYPAVRPVWREAAPSYVHRTCIVCGGRFAIDVDEARYPPAPAAV